jgi:non-heme chloroperoxidase
MNRRQIFQTVGLGGLAAVAVPATRSAAVQMALGPSKSAGRQPSFVPAMDGTRLFVQDWGASRPVLFLAAWAFHSNVWGAHIAALTARGFRCVASDRRGHGRSDAPGAGYDTDSLADDVAAVVEHLDLRDIVLVAHSMASIEAIRYLTRHGASRIGQLVLRHQQHHS